jgi:hypothetical protein
VAGGPESGGGGRLEVSGADAAWTAGRRVTAARGGRMTVEVVSGDARRRASAGTVDISRATGDDRQGPAVAPSQAEGVSGLGGRRGARPVTETGMMAVAATVGRGHGVGSGGGLNFFKVWKGTMRHTS